MRDLTPKEQAIVEAESAELARRCAESINTIMASEKIAEPYSGDAGDETDAG